MTPEAVLITGGLGFQGFHLAVRLASEGRAVTVLNTPSQRALDAAQRLGLGIRVVWGSVTDVELLDKLVPTVDAVVHMAAWTSVDVSLERPWPYFEANVRGTVTLLNALRDRSLGTIRVLIASSCEVYGSQVLTSVLQRETDEHRPRSPYAASKSAADRFAYAFARAYDLQLTILRPCNVYGPWQRTGATGAVLPTMTQAALCGYPLMVTGDGSQQREFLHVDDVVEAYRFLLDREPDAPGEAFNVGSGHLCSIRQLADIVVTRFDLPASRILHSPARPADASRFCLDTGKLHATGWKPRVTDGFSSYWEWVERKGKAWLMRRR